MVVKVKNPIHEDLVYNDENYVPFNKKINETQNQYINNHDLLNNVLLKSKIDTTQQNFANKHGFQQDNSKLSFSTNKEALLDNNELESEYEFLIHLTPQQKRKYACYSLTAIYNELGYKNLELNRKGQTLSLQSRIQLENEIQHKLEVHLESYSQTMQNVLLPAFEGFCHMLGAIAGAGWVGGFAQAFIGASKGAGQELGNYHGAEVKAFDHLNQSQQRLIQEYVSSRQQLAQNDDRWREVTRQSAQDVHELFKQISQLA